MTTNRRLWIRRSQPGGDDWTMKNAPIASLPFMCAYGLGRYFNIPLDAEKLWVCMSTEKPRDEDFYEGVTHPDLILQMSAPQYSVTVPFFTGWRIQFRDLMGCEELAYGVRFYFWIEL